MPPRKQAKSAVDSAVKLDTLTLLRLRTADAEHSNAQAQFRALSVEIDSEIAKLPKLKDLIEARGAMLASISERKAQVKVIHDEIETRFKVKVTECAIDDETGLIHHLVDGEIPKLVSESKTKKRK